MDELEVLTLNTSFSLRNNNHSTASSLRTPSREVWKGAPSPLCAELEDCYKGILQEPL